MRSFIPGLFHITRTSTLLLFDRYIPHTSIGTNFACGLSITSAAPKMEKPPLVGTETAPDYGDSPGPTEVDSAKGVEGTVSQVPAEMYPSNNDLNEKPKMSRRAMKRMKRTRQREMAKGSQAAKKQKKDTELNFSEQSLKDTEYYFENGLRKVYPYFFTFKTYAKGRWVGQKMLDIFASEFKAYKIETYEEAIKSGRVTVNRQKVGLDYVFKDNDYVENVVHRHELPVVGSRLNIIEDSEHFVIVDKPSSIPIHPCGRYRHNSLTYIMAIEHGYRNLRTIYRLDRLTSGVFIFCKTDSQTRLMQSHIKKRQVEKSYLARVCGEFPSNPVVCSEPIDNLTQKIGLFKVGPNGKEAKTSFERISYNGETSVVLCKPHTGRTHQIRVHLQFIGYPIVNDPLYNSAVWGPERGKGGNFGKPEEQLVDELIKHHTAERFECDALIETIPAPVGNDGDTPEVPAPMPHPSDSKSVTDTLSRERLTDLNTTVVNVVEESTKDSKMKSYGRVVDSHLGNLCGFPLYDPNKLTTDPVCEECKRRYVNPKESDLMMYLHALSYKGPGWFFKTDMPDWAREDWVPHQ